MHYMVDDIVSTLHDGLAIYQRGSGVPVLLMPYPHASTMRTMVTGDLAGLLVEMGMQVITFDPPGAFESKRMMKGDMAEMLTGAGEALTLSAVDTPVHVVGHSMGGLCALAFAITYPLKVDRLILIGSCSGFPAVRRWGIPHNWRWYRHRAWWQSMWWGTRQMLNLGNLAVHKKLDNLIQAASYVRKDQVLLWQINPEDGKRPPPVRSSWLRTVRSIDYAARLQEVHARTLLCVGRFDPQTPIPCSLELAQGIPNAELVVFEHSGHAPFSEESGRFSLVLREFLGHRN